MIYEYLLDLHGSISMSSDTLYSNCPFIRSSMVYFTYLPGMCCGPINSDPFTLYASVVCIGDCNKHNATEIMNTERPMSWFERSILPIDICFLFAGRERKWHQSPNANNSNRIECKSTTGRQLTDRSHRTSAHWIFVLNFFYIIFSVLEWYCTFIGAQCAL